MSKHKTVSMFDPAIVRSAIKDSFTKLDPRTLYKNPVMFVVAIGSLLTTILLVRDIAAGQTTGSTTGSPVWFTAAVTLWLWFTVVFANFAEAVAEGRGKAQADTLRKMRQETVARRVVSGRAEPETIPASQLRKDDLVVIVGALTFFPAVSLGPVVEHFQALHGEVQ